MDKVIHFPEERKHVYFMDHCNVCKCKLDKSNTNELTLPRKNKPTEHKGFCNECFWMIEKSLFLIGACINDE